MEASPTNVKQVEVKIEDVGPDETVVIKKWGPPPAPTKKWGNHPTATWRLPEPTEEEEYFRINSWKGTPTTETQIRSEELRKVYEQDRILVENGETWYRTELKTYDLLCESFFDSRWFRSVYWDQRTQQYESRAPYKKGSAPKQVPWEPPADWKKESFEEFKERIKFWKQDGIRLEHEDVVLGAKYQLYEHPNLPPFRVVGINDNPLPPKVLIKEDRTNRAWSVFTDELDKTVHNSRRNIKNWTKRRRAAYNYSGTSVWDTVVLEENPVDDRKTPFFPGHHLCFSA